MVLPILIGLAATTIGGSYAKEVVNDTTRLIDTRRTTIAMEFYLLSGLTFMWAFNKVRPARVVDTIIEFVHDIFMPGRGTGGFMKRMEKSAVGIVVRNELKLWDEAYPFVHHELLIRWCTGLLASSVAMCTYNFLRGRRGR